MIVNRLPRTRLHALNVSVLVNRSVHVFVAIVVVFPVGVGHLGAAGVKVSGLVGNPAVGFGAPVGRTSAPGSLGSSRSLSHCCCPEKKETMNEIYANIITVFRLAVLEHLTLCNLHLIYSTDSWTEPYLHMNEN